MISEAVCKRIDELFEDEMFCNEIEKATSKEEIHQVLVENGVEIEFDDFVEGIEGGKQALKDNGYINNNGELSEELLQMVSGGGWGSRIFKSMVAGGTAFLAVSVGLYGCAGLLVIAAGASIAGY